MLVVVQSLAPPHFNMRVPNGPKALPKDCRLALVAVVQAEPFQYSKVNT